MLASGLITATVATRDRVYTVPQVLAGLARDPQAWSGRTATVWGTALRVSPACPPAHWCVSGLYQPYTRRPGPILLLEPGRANPLVVRLCHVVGADQRAEEHTVLLHGVRPVGEDEVIGWRELIIEVA